MRTLPILMMLAYACAAQQVSTQELLQMARMRAAGLERAVRDTLGADNIQKGTAAAGEMGDFVFAVAADKGPSLQINNEAPIAAFKAGSLWVVQSRSAAATTCLRSGPTATPSRAFRRVSLPGPSKCPAKFMRA